MLGPDPKFDNLTGFTTVLFELIFLSFAHIPSPLPFLLGFYYSLQIAPPYFFLFLFKCFFFSPMWHWPISHFPTSTLLFRTCYLHIFAYLSFCSFFHSSIYLTFSPWIYSLSGLTLPSFNVFGAPFLPLFFCVCLCMFPLFFLAACLLSLHFFHVFVFFLFYSCVCVPYSSLCVPFLPLFHLCACPFFLLFLHCVCVPFHPLIYVRGPFLTLFTVPFFPLFSMCVSPFFLYFFRVSFFSILDNFPSAPHPN
jgi:hypothetical protein